MVVRLLIAYMLLTLAFCFRGGFWKRMLNPGGSVLGLRETRPPRPSQARAFTGWRSAGSTMR